MINSTVNSDVTFFGKMLTFSRIKLATNDFDIIEEQLNTISPEKNSLIPIVIDCDVDIDLTKLRDLLWDWGLQPIGVIKGKLDKQAEKLKMAIFPSDGKRIQRVNAQKPNKQNSSDHESKNKTEPKKNTKESHVKFHKEQKNEETNKKNQDINNQEKITTQVSKITSLVYDQMLRSGQSINHVGGDLILTNSVNDGAEAITDNSLHIYGKGMGRLVAGATGDQEAHIFCQRFNPSLVSVAGTYMLRDSIPEEVINQPVQVSYKKGKGLVFRVMDDWLKNSTNSTINDR